MNIILLHESILKHTRFTFSRSGGKGGQNVNKVNTKVFAFIPCTLLEGISEAELAQIKVRLSSYINKDGEFFVSVQQERSQELNRKIALQLIESKLLSAGKILPPRKKSKIPRAINEKRLQQKRLTAQTKQLRSKIW